MGGIYLIQSDDQLVEMSEREYDSEELLQILLAKYPSILAGDQMNIDAPRRWLLVRREVGVPAKEGGAGYWSLDHLFMDQDAIPTLVEVKRSSDSRARREVVAQMLDYAANAVVYWPVETIRAQFEADRQEAGLDPTEVMTAFLQGGEEEEFWQKAKTNLQAGRVRMVFVADAIPAELRRIVEFLNGQMDPAEVLAVEIKQYVGGNLKTLVPRVIGQTADAQIKKAGATGGGQWDEESFLEALEAHRGGEDRDIASRIMSWAKQRNLEPWWGRGRKWGSYIPILDPDGEREFVFCFWTNGYVQVLFTGLKPPFDNESAKSELARRLNTIPGARIEEQDIQRSPSVWFNALRSDDGFKQFLGIFDWVIESYKAGKLL